METRWRPSDWIKDVGLGERQSKRHRTTLFTEQRRLVADREDVVQVRDIGGSHPDLACGGGFIPPAEHQLGELERIAMWVRHSKPRSAVATTHTAAPKELSGLLAVVAAQAPRATRSDEQRSTLQSSAEIARVDSGEDFDLRPRARREAGGGLLVHPREVFEAALLANAAAIIVTHYVVRHIMRLMWPESLCGGVSASAPTSAVRRSKEGT